MVSVSGRIILLFFCNKFVDWFHGLGYVSPGWWLGQDSLIIC